VKRVVHRLGLQTVAKRAYWAAMSSWIDPKTVEVAGTTAWFRVESMAEYETIESAVVAERPLLADLLSRLRPDDVFYDVGGNVGTYTCFVASALDDGEVVAFEPYPPNAARCRENAALDDLDVTVLQVVLADESGIVDLGVQRGGDVGTQEHSIDPDYRTPRRLDGAVTVETARIDDLVADGLPAPTVVKMDVEGAGDAAIDGMTDALGRSDCRVVYCEPHDDAAALRDRLDALGFSIEPVWLSGHRSASQRAHARDATDDTRSRTTSSEPRRTRGDGRQSRKRPGEPLSPPTKTAFRKHLYGSHPSVEACPVTCPVQCTPAASA